MLSPTPTWKPRYLLTRGTSWKRLYTWKLVQMADQPSEPNLLTCQDRKEISKYLTADEAARVAFKVIGDAELYMWDDPGYIPGPSLQGHKAVRVIATAVRSVGGLVWAAQNAEVQNA